MNSAIPIASQRPEADGFRRRSTHPTNCPLRPEQGEIDHVKPAQNAVDDRPEDRVVVGIGDRDRERRAKADAVFGALDPNSIETISVHLSTSVARHWFRVREFKFLCEAPVRRIMLVPDRSFKSVCQLAANAGQGVGTIRRRADIK